MKNIYITLLVYFFSIPSLSSKEKLYMMTVKGIIPVSEMGISLIHEHILVDFIGADSICNDRWENEKVIERTLPFLSELKTLGCQTLVECTPAYLGRDPLLLHSLSGKSGIHIITNTGLYGAGNNKFIPQYAFSETADELAERWVTEWEDGIEGTGIKPGFIKIGVDGGHLSDMHRKLITAAARTHLKTGLVIVSHTGPSIPAFEQAEILRKEGVSPEAFIWTHAQAERNSEIHVKAAEMGIWISLDGIHDNNIDDYVGMIRNMKMNGLLHKVLLSHDAGWYSPGEENGGSFRGFGSLFNRLLPALRKNGIDEKDIEQLLIVNPAKAFAVQVHPLN